MNRGLNLPQIQRIMNEFEKESSMMDMKEEMMSDAVDDVMDDEVEDEEAEGEKILKEVLDEIGMDLTIGVRLNYYVLALEHYLTRVLIPQLKDTPTALGSAPPLTTGRQAVAIGASDGPPVLPSERGGAAAGGGGGGELSDEDALQARLDNLRRM